MNVINRDRNRDRGRGRDRNNFFFFLFENFYYQRGVNQITSSRAGEFFRLKIRRENFPWRTFAAHTRRV